MSIESALVDHLLADATISSLISARLFPDVAPQESTFPRITYQVIGAEHPQHTGGGSGIAQVRIQIDVWASTALSRRTTVDALRDRLQAYTGTMGDEALPIRAVFVEGPTNTYEPPIHGDEAGIYRGRFEATVWHTESVPSH